MTEELGVVQDFYAALADRDPAALLGALHEDFVLTLSPGLPLAVDREFRGRESAVANVWGRIPADVELHCEPDRKLPVGPGEFVVLGHYRGDGWSAPFAHVVSMRDGRIGSLRQITDTRSWPDLRAAG
ncbi:nuclear transport factor 2 family protein [Kribbella shirazensis]|uniref:Ketosteroid isomerase-like protein n=1 Tax=Kribbella shirazensis TaxID=1105143 RepID=A0A7X5VDK6_9ACTN|nr:nuclear transport factor 2 family protein [Kribbella shirazensis]NIK59039.1 ketosteroid isomerase-like protein [Kribbella shirazensis]